MIAHKIRKRSLIGSRVAVPTGNGFYVPATVQAVCCNDDGKECITAILSNNQTSEYPIPDVIGHGNGLKNIANARLQKFQKVFFKMNDTENMGYVINTDGDDAIVSFADIKKGKIRLPMTELSLVEHRPQQKNESTRESRKTNIVNSSPHHIKRRIVSESIEVPKISRARKSSEEPTMDELMAAMVLTNMSSSPIFHNPKSPLIKRDVSPHSYGSSGVGSWNQDVHMSPTKEETDLPSDQNIDQDLTSPDRNNNPASPEDPIETDSDINDHVPHTQTHMYEDREPQHNMVRNTTPHPIKRENLMSMSPNRPTVLVSPRSQPYPLKSSKLSSVTEENSNAVPLNQHQIPLAPVYYVHNMYSQLQQLNYSAIGTPPSMRAVTLEDRPYRDLSPLVTGQPPTEEQNLPPYVGSAPPSIYFPLMHTNTSLPSSPNSFSSQNYARHTSSPLSVGQSTASISSGQRPTASLPISVGGRYTVLQDHCYQTGPAQPINIPTAKAFSWHSSHIAPSQKMTLFIAPNSKATFSPKPSLVQQRQHMHQAASPKMPAKQTLPPGRSKVRGDGKKCRKVYGMENRDMWCTACRWKKACQRFPD